MAASLPQNESVILKSCSNPALVDILFIVDVMVLVIGVGIL